MLTECMEMDECLQIGDKACDRIIENVIKSLNENHSAVNSLPFVTNLSLELYKQEKLLEDFDSKIVCEIDQLILDEFEKLDESTQHCVFLYCDSEGEDEYEIAETIRWWVEDQINEIGTNLINRQLKDEKVLS